MMGVLTVMFAVVVVCLYYCRGTANCRCERGSSEEQEEQDMIALDSFVLKHGLQADGFDQAAVRQVTRRRAFAQRGCTCPQQCRADCRDKPVATFCGVFGLVIGIAAVVGTVIGLSV